MQNVLNVGGGNKAIPIPKHYAGFKHDLLDIDPAGRPEICLDARELSTLPAGQYHAIYCSHNIEHYHRHHAARVVQGFHHVLRTSGFVELRLPDLTDVMRTVVARNLDLDDVLYVSPAGPILVRDVVYGYHVEIERSGNDFYTHKTAFSPRGLILFMTANGFPCHAVTSRGFEIEGYFFKQPPKEDIITLLGLRMRPFLSLKLTTKHEDTKS